MCSLQSSLWRLTVPRCLARMTPTEAGSQGSRRSLCAPYSRLLRRRTSGSGCHVKCATVAGATPHPVDVGYALAEKDTETYLF
jgi:hypothetical protein